MVGSAIGIDEGRGLRLRGRRHLGRGEENLGREVPWDAERWSLSVSARVGCNTALSPGPWNHGMHSGGIRA